MAFPTTSILDSGTGSNANPIAGNWTTDPNSTGWAALQRTTNQIAGTAAGGDGAYWNVGNFGPDCEAYCTIPALSVTTGEGVAAIGRINVTGSQTTSQMYQAVLQRTASTYKLQLFKHTGNAFTQLGTDDLTVLSAGDQLGLECKSTAIKLYYNHSGGGWTASANCAATDSSISAAGKIGLESDGTTYRITNFGGGTVVVAGGNSTVAPSSGMHFPYYHE